MKDKMLIIRIILSLIITAVLGYGIYSILNEGVTPSYQIETNGISNNTVVGEITSDILVEQEVLGTKEFQGVRMLLATYANPNIDASYKMQIVTEEGKVLCEDTIHSGDIEDNKYYYLSLDKQLNLSGETLKIIISSKDSTNGNAITIWKSSSDIYTKGQLFINGEITDGDIVFDYITNVSAEKNIGVLIYRIATFLLVYAFVALNVWCPLRKLYEFIFKYRLAIVVGLFAFFVLNGIHYSSVGMYDQYVQTGLGSGYNEPIWGNAQAIRSDEWLVSLPRRLSVAFAGVGDSNYIPMAMEVGNLTSSGIELGWGAFTRPYEWGYLTGNTEIGVSWYWNFLMLFTVFFSFEMCLILSKGKKLLSAVGAVLIGYSPFFLWWGVAIWLMSGQGAIVCLHHAISSENKWKKLFFGFWTAIFGACFVVVLYPAWQVPAGYLFLVLLITLIVSKWEKIKAFDKKDWAIIAGCVLFMGSIIIAHFLSYTEYMTAISQTVYPGERVSAGGDYIGKLFNYIGSWLFAFKSVANASETGIIINLFPLPMILSVLYMIKTKKMNGLLTSLLCLSLFLTAYCYTGIPMWLSKITMMSSSIPGRAVDILALVQLYLLIVVAGHINEDNKCKRLPMYAITGACVLWAAYNYEMVRPSYFNKYQLIAIVLVITFCFATWIARTSKYEKIVATTIVCVITIYTGFFVNPVMKGLDVIYTKPAAQAIMEIVKEEPKAKWIATDSIATSGFTVACGAPTINSTNFIPNYDLWEKLDSDGEYEENWNRYAHFTIHLVEEDTVVNLPQEDTISVRLSYSDLEKIGVKYIFAVVPVSPTDTVDLELIYNEAGSYIYKVNYN